MQWEIYQDNGNSVLVLETGYVHKIYQDGSIMESGVIVLNDFLDGSKGVINCGRPTDTINIRILDT